MHSFPHSLITKRMEMSNDKALLEVYFIILMSTSFSLGQFTLIVRRPYQCVYSLYLYLTQSTESSGLTHGLVQTLKYLIP